MMVDPALLLGFIGSGGAGAVLIKTIDAVVARRSSRDDADVKARIAENSVAHLLLQEVRDELGLTKAELEKLRARNESVALQQHNESIALLRNQLAYFDEALMHLEAIIFTTDLVERAKAEADATVFLRAMRLLRREMEQAPWDMTCAVAEIDRKSS